MAQQLYTTTAVERFISRSVENGQEIYELIEGTLGYGLTVITPTDKYKGAVIKEVYLNPWSSAHTVRHYSKLPQKYEKMIEEWFSQESSAV